MSFRGFVFHSLRSWFLAKQQTSPKLIRPKDMSSAALEVTRLLQKRGHQAFVVGGGVRDVLLNKPPKDFDVVTDALPEACAAIFRRSRIIGRRFRLVHVYCGKELVEVSTFRCGEESGYGQNGGLNCYGTMEEDLPRRDFTCNAILYDPIADRLIDPFNGIEDLSRRQLVVIGDPVQRFTQDPLRILRALRLSAKCHLAIEARAKVAIKQQLGCLQQVSPARLLDEWHKLFFHGHAVETYRLCVEFELDWVILPLLRRYLPSQPEHTNQLIQLALQATDRRFAQGLSLNPGFLWSILLWPAFQVWLQRWQATLSLSAALHHALNDALAEQQEALRIPKRYCGMIRAIWLLQFQLERRRPQRIVRIVEHRYYRAAFDFLALRAQSGEALADCVAWWQQFYTANRQQRAQLIDQLSQKKEQV